MDVGGIGEKTNAEGVDGSITPALVEESTGAIQVLEVRLVLFAAEEVEITDLEVRPEVAGGVSIRGLGVLGTSHVIRNPLPHVVVAEVRRVGGEESLGFGPKGRDTLRCVVQVDGEAVGLVAILHVTEHIVVDIAEELDIGFDAPVVAVVFEGRVFVEHAAVPATHLVVGDLGAILDVLFLQKLCRLAEEVHIDPFWDVPVFLGHKFCI